MELTVDGDAGELTLGFLAMLHDSVLSVHRQGFVPKGFKPESKRFGGQPELGRVCKLCLYGHGSKRYWF